jgi:hypothetical protein
VASNELLFSHSVFHDEPLELGDALRWGDGEVWRVEEVDQAGRMILRLWPGEVDYPERIKGTSAP